VEILTELMMKASSWLTLLPRISLRNIFEIAIISFLVYEILDKKYKGMDIVKRTFSHIGIFHYGCSFASGYDCLDP